MNKGFSQAAASRAVAIDAVRQTGKRVEAGSRRCMVSVPLNVRAQNHADQAAVYA